MRSHEGLASALSKADWTRTDLPGPADATPIDAFFRSDFGWAAFIFARTIADAIERWAPAQSELAEFRSSPEGKRKDIYLVFVLDEIPTSGIPMLQDITDDTYVCRKVVLERRGRPYDEVLRELPPFSMADEVPAPGTLTPLLPGSLLSDDLLNDLAKRSAGVVLDRLVAGDYPETGVEE